MNGGMHWEYLIDVRALCVGESNPTPTTKKSQQKEGREAAMAAVCWSWWWGVE